MTFEEWFYGIENYSLRAERFYNEIDPDSRIDTKAIVSWLEAAYKVGYEHRNKELMDDGK
ncbi:hypothetical protein UFOVP447_30 [uncultured Caudovirales phage]|uniref:Uncharacterized protein n=1 Tax=uncultured Caudovirales phage TaxID=2100421 RepID=A0A6J5M6T7_9CAUD|nr:hypothetical protein UFOVP447_30 [uncultured Caudovirales phage]